MSGANKLKEKILAEANSQAEQTLEEARARAAQIAAKGEQDAEARKKSVLEQARVQADERRRRAQTIAGLDARKAVLAAKEELIEETFRQAVSRLQNMDSKAYEDMIFSMLLTAVQTGNEQVIVSARDKERFTPEFLDRVNRELAKQGKQGNLALAAETREIQGGFILRAGDVEINSSFDSILRMQRDRLEPEVAAILFG